MIDIFMDVFILNSKELNSKQVTNNIIILIYIYIHPALTAAG
jgi:hypothetical protein